MTQHDTAFRCRQMTNGIINGSVTHMTTRYFSRDELDELGLPWSGKDKEFIESGRWSERWTCVFECDGKNYRIEYELPATEYQEGLDEFERYETADGVPATEVELREITVLKWFEVE